jgi:endoglucanase
MKHRAQTRQDSIRFIAGLLLLALACFVTVQSEAQATTGGYYHTSGARILDSQNNPVRIAGINWYGFETSSKVVNGLYAQDYHTILLGIRAHGFNTIRIPLSSEVIEHPATSLHLASTNQDGPINADLEGLNSLEVLDRIIVYAGQLGLKVILDHHRSEAGNSAQPNGLWYTAAYPESAWIADWVALAHRYQTNPTVIGFDLHNEPHSTPHSGGACWDCGSPNDWHLAAQRAANAVLAVNPSLLIFVEGTDTYNGDSTWWGGNLAGVARSPITLAYPNRLVYSVHDYGPHESAQPWFNTQTSYATLATFWTRHWAFISQSGIAPVLVGEFGTTNASLDAQSATPGSDAQWFQSLIHFLQTNPNISWAYWALNGEDTYALLDPKYSPQPVSQIKTSLLATISAPHRPPPPHRHKTTPPITVTLTMPPSTPTPTHNPPISPAALAEVNALFSSR